MNSYHLLPIALLLCCFARPVIAAEESTNSRDASAAITTLLAGKYHPLLRNGDFSGDLDDVSALYRLANNELLWLGENRSQRNIDDALEILAHADAQGLDPQDYAGTGLRQDVLLASTMSQTAAKELALYDTALSISLLRYLHDLHYGRIKPRDIHYPDNFASKRLFDSAARIKQALEQQTLAGLPRAFEPKLKQYQQLKQALADYRLHANDAAPTQLVFEKSLRPDDSYPQLAELKQRLMALGVLPTPSSEQQISYSGELVDGVIRFQQQQGLQADGVIGKETAALLNQSTADKISRIELAMERLRWLPDDIDGPAIIVNIPAFQLWAFDALDDKEALTMRVIVGKAQQHQTPVLFETMKYLEFMPYWNIPKSILDKEILPKLMDDLAYLQDQDIEVVQRDDGEEDSVEAIFDDLRHGRVRARQRPGSKNPLGKVKFVFPNKEDVYLHDTPSHGLFNRSRRDFSHGCVRVAEADKLAEFVLSRQEGWDMSAIQQAMSGGKTQRVTLKQSIPVLFFYTTAFVAPDNRVYFYRDIYGHDSVLQKALERSRQPGGSSLLTAGNAAAS